MAYLNQNSRTTKTLTYTLKAKLEPLATELNNFEIEKNKLEEYLEKIRKEEISKIDENITNKVNEIKAKIAELEENIANYNNLINEIIINGAIDINVPIGGGNIGLPNPLTDSKFIKDKHIKTILYNLKDSTGDIVVAAIPNKGLAIGPNVPDAEFEFYNPDNSKFSAYMVNDMLKITDSKILIAAENGIYVYDLMNKSYIKMTTINGLPSNRILYLRKVKTSNNAINGYLAFTDNGVAWSPSTLQKWHNIDNSFNVMPIGIYTLKNNHENETNHILIGTAKGLYYFDLDNLTANESNTIDIKRLGISDKLNNLFINNLALDFENDKLYIITENNCTVISNIIEGYIKALKNPANDEIYFDNFYNNNIVIHRKLGYLESSILYDIMLLGDRIIISTGAGIFLTKDFVTSVFLTQKDTLDSDNNNILNEYVVYRLARKDDNTITAIHAVGYTENIDLTTYD